MKSFFLLFSDSAKELKKVSTLTVSGLFVALAIVLRNLTINVSADLRINFAFLGAMIIGMLYGPVLSIMGSVSVDIIGYFLDGFKARDYNFALLLVKIIAGLIYGVMLYKKATNKSLIVNTVISRILVVIICQLILNSIVLYYCYQNKNFPFMSGSEWSAFGIWMTPRLIKNGIMLPIEIALSVMIIPMAKQSYIKVFKRKTA
ncbi:MAG: folate family ECF transporter S component [Ruminococcus sp.]|nr:folate family ECF transporter S component [Ruminococcus sp.]